MMRDETLTDLRKDFEPPEVWDDPILFSEIETPEIPAILLPAPLCNFTSALALASETPEALAVMTVLGAISSVVSRNYVVSPRDGWHEPTNLYIIVALPPGNNKSLILRYSLEPLSEWEKEQRLKLEPEIKRQRSERKSQEKIIESMRSSLKSQKNHLEQENLIRLITEKETSLSEPLALPSLFATDVTPESLATSLYEQNSHFAIFSDEGGCLEVLSGLYTSGTANVDIVLKGIDGGNVRIRRKDKDFNINPILTIVLTVQPSIIQRMAEKKAYCGNGFLERFLYVIPKSKLGYRNHNTPPVPIGLIEEYRDLVKRLLISTSETIGGERCKKVLLLSPEALEHWKRFQLEIEPQFRPDGIFHSQSGWAGKICGFALRIAGILHVVQSTKDDLTISNSTMSKALSLAELLAEHAIAAYSAMGSDQSLRDAKDVLDWVMQQSSPGFSQTEIIRAMRNRKLGKRERLSKALEVLVDRNILREKIDKATRKPTRYFLISPKLKEAS